MTKWHEGGRDDRIPEAKYANYLEVGHNPFEFLLEFGQHQEGDTEPLFHSRIIANPVYAKAFLDLLRAAVDSYEATFGPIQTPTNEDAEVEDGQD